MKYNKQIQIGNEWVRKDGWFAGVCEGLADRFGVSANLIRVLWLISILCFGVGLLIYIVLALTLPHENQFEEAYQDSVLGVCYRLHEKTGIDLGLIRFLTVMFALSSFGTAAILYLLFWFFLPEPSENF